MTALLFTGCVLVGYSVPIVVFLYLFARRAQLVIVSISASFFWLISTMVSSTIWYFVVPLQNVPWFIVPLGVFSQEAGRYIFFTFYAKAEASFSVISTNAIAFPMSDFYSATAAGLGFGVISSLLLDGSILAFSTGPGTIFSDTCPHFSTFVISAWNAFFMNIFHIFLMVIAFDGYRRRSPVIIAGVVLTHLAAGLLTLFYLRMDGCYYVLPSIAVIVCLTCAGMCWIVTRPTYRSKRRI